MRSFEKKVFQLLFFLSYKSKYKKVNLGLFYFKNEWDFKNELPLNDTQGLLMIKKKQLILENLILDLLSGENYSLEDVKNSVLGKKKIEVSDSYFDFFQDFIDELKLNDKGSSAKAYENALSQLKKYRSELKFTDLDYTLLSKFKDWRLRLGNSKNTIATYLSKYRSVYNEAVKRKITEDAKPFKDVFNGGLVKSNRTKKRYLNKETIKVFEDLNLSNAADQRAVDLFLLLFYFGGQDLKDVYYLERKQIANNRVFFTRGKLDGYGYEFDLKIVPKAQSIIDKYKVPGKYVFGWRKDFDGYKTFRANFRRNLLKVVDNYNKEAVITKAKLIKVLPKGGNITIKVARHSFATIGKLLFIDTDLLRELMGHERNDVDTIYKDKYSEKVRDKAHLQIID